MTIENDLKKQLARKYGITLKQVEEIISHQHKFVAKVIGEMSDRDKLYFPSIRLPGFGVFYCPESVKEKLREINKKKDAAI